MTIVIIVTFFALLLGIPLLSGFRAGLRGVHPRETTPAAGRDKHKARKKLWSLNTILAYGEIHPGYTFQENKWNDE